jgi:hypothetical protein
MRFMPHLLNISESIRVENLEALRTSRHRKASEHSTHAAKHHAEAAKHHDAGQHEKAAHHAHTAGGHERHARNAFRRSSKGTRRRVWEEVALRHYKHQGVKLRNSLKLLGWRRLGSSIEPFNVPRSITISPSKMRVSCQNATQMVSITRASHSRKRGRLVKSPRHFSSSSEIYR